MGRRSGVGSWLRYLLMLGGAAAALALIRHLGVGLAHVPAAPAPAASVALRSEILFHVLLALAAVLTLGHGVGALFARLGQPAVIGEVVAGLLLGPSFLGALWPAAGSYLLPAPVAPFLAVIAQLGIILYMFQVGLALDHAHLRGRGHSLVTISHASIIVPFLLGAALSLWLFPRFAPAGVSFIAFALFLGVAMAITAFPVLARILSDQGLSRTPLGSLALACAAVDDATAWCLLAAVVAVVDSKARGLVWTALWLAGFVAAMLVLAQPLLRRLAARVDRGRLSRTVMAVVVVGVLVSSLSTEMMGIHAVFGAFLLGALIPHDSRLARELEARLKDLVSTLLLPAFFVFTGMRTQISLVNGGQAWLAVGLIVLVATVGKFGGAWISARLSGIERQEALALGILMNTRGLVELIVLNIGLDLGVISPRLFAMMVLMALVTTLGTAPALRLFTPGLLRRPSEESINVVRSS